MQPYGHLSIEMVKYLQLKEKQGGGVLKELVTMWKYSTMVAITVLCAGIFMLFLLPFKSIQLIPGFAEFRPATLLPVLFGLLFGPAGAWGSAIGNFAADFFGTLSLGSIFGFVGNFLYAYIPYKIWRRKSFRHREDSLPTINTPWKLMKFGSASITASVACALIIAWGIDALKLVPFVALSTVITLNNAVITLLLGPIILPLIYKPVKKARLLWTDIMHHRDISKPGEDKNHLLMVYIGTFGGFAAGILLSLLFAGQVLLGVGISTEGAGSLVVDLGLVPFLVLLFYGSFNA